MHEPWSRDANSSVFGEDENRECSREFKCKCVAMALLEASLGIGERTLANRYQTQAISGAVQALADIVGYLINGAAHGMRPVSSRWHECSADLEGSSGARPVERPSARSQAHTGSPPGQTPQKPVACFCHQPSNSLYVLDFPRATVQPQRGSQDNGRAAPRYQR